MLQHVGTCSTGFIWGLASSGFHARKFYLKAADVAVEKEKEMSADDLLLSVWAFARTMRPADIFLRRAMDRLPNVIHTYDSYQLLSLSYALTQVPILNSIAILMCALVKKIRTGCHPVAGEIYRVKDGHIRC